MQGTDQRTTATTDTPWLTTDEAAAYLKLSTQTIRAACRDDKLRHVQPGGVRGKILTTRAWLDQWVTRHAQGGS